MNRLTLSEPFERKILSPVLPKAPLELRLFTTVVKTDSAGRIITGPNSDPVKKILGAEPAGGRAGLDRFTKIMFAADYFDGQPAASHRIDPNSPEGAGGGTHWPFVKQPFRGWPYALALTSDGKKPICIVAGPRGLPGLALRSGRHRATSRYPLGGPATSGADAGHTTPAPGDLSPEHAKTV